MKKRLLLFLCIFTLLLSTAAQAEDVTADVPAPASPDPALRPALATP